jgi:hypothetical protein
MGLGMACRSFRRIWPMLELRVPRWLFPSRLPTLRLWSPWLLASGVRTLRLCACEFWWRFRSRHGRGFPRRRAPLDPPMSDIPRVVFFRLQKEIAGCDDAERKKVIHRRSRFFRHSRVARRGLPNRKGGAAQAIGLRDHDRHRTPGRAVQGGDHAIVVRSTRCWREVDSKLRSLRSAVLRRNTNSFREIDKARRLGTVAILARNRKFESIPLRRRVIRTRRRPAPPKAVQPRPLAAVPSSKPSHQNSAQAAPSREPYYDRPRSRRGSVGLDRRAHPSPAERK